MLLVYSWILSQRGPAATPILSLSSQAEEATRFSLSFSFFLSFFLSFSLSLSHTHTLSLLFSLSLSLSLLIFLSFILPFILSLSSIYYKDLVFVLYCFESFPCVLSHSTLGKANHLPRESEIKQIMKESNEFALAASLIWCLWVLMATICSPSHTRTLSLSLSIYLSIYLSFSRSLALSLPISLVVSSSRGSYKPLLLILISAIWNLLTPDWVNMSDLKDF